MSVKPSRPLQARPRRVLRRRGFALLEMLFCLMIVTLAFDVAFRLIHLTLRTHDDTAKASHRMKMNEQWIELMRQDVWNARTRSTGDGTRLTLDGDRVAWRTEAGTLIRDAVTLPPQTWPIESQVLRWTETGGGLLSLSDGNSTIPFASGAPAQAGER